MTKSKSKSRGAPAVTVAVTLATFDSTVGRPVYRALREGTTLADFAAVTEDEYAPAGMTPLLDATVEFIEHLRSLKRDDVVNVGLLLDESGSMGSNRRAVVEAVNKFVDGLRRVDRVDDATAGKGFLVIATDGYENASTRYGYEEVREQVKRCEEDGWVTVFIGASIDGWGAGRKIGLSGGVYGQTVSSVNTPVGTYAAMGSVAVDAASFLASSGEYVRSRASSAMRSVTEDGDETLTNIGAPTKGPQQPIKPPPQPGNDPHNPFDPNEAIDSVVRGLFGT